MGRLCRKESDGSAEGRFDEVCIWQNIREICQNKPLLKWEPLGVINSSGSCWKGIFDIKYFAILLCDILLCWKPKISTNLFHFIQTDPAQLWTQVSLRCFQALWFCCFTYFAICTWKSCFGRKTTVLLYLVVFMRKMLKRRWQIVIPCLHTGMWKREYAPTEKIKNAVNIQVLGIEWGSLRRLGKVISLHLHRLQGHVLPPRGPEAVWHHPAQSEEQLETLDAAQAFVLIPHLFPTLQTISPTCLKQARISVSLKIQLYTFKIRHVEASRLCPPSGTQMQWGSVSQTETNWKGHKPSPEVTKDWCDTGNRQKERNLHQKIYISRVG